jgi:4-hydroxy-3-polyprenylbenzoate decarboxylase
MPAFYTMPASVAEIVDQTVARILDQLGLAHTLSNRWGSVTT